MGIFAGIDAGGTKTRAVLVDEQGRVLASLQAGPCAIVGDPTPAQGEFLATLLPQLCGQAGLGQDQVRHVGAGLSGLDFSDELPSQKASLARIFGVEPANAAFVNDAIPALWGASPAPSLVLLQLGTAFTSAIRLAHGSEQVLDHLDIGAIFDLRQASVAMVARMIDGRRKASGLKQKMMQAFGVAKESDFAERAFRMPARERARLAPAVVYQAWEEGDAGAQELLDRAAEDYALMAAAAARRAGGSTPWTLCLGGGVLRGAPDALFKLTQEKLRQQLPAATVQRPQLAPEIGAALMAAHQAGIEPVELFQKLLTSTRS